MTGEIRADREHIVDLSPAEVAALREWLIRPNGSHGHGRVSFNAVEGGGVMVRTQPYRYVASKPRGEAR